jgi:hypothetical protein
MSKRPKLRNWYDECKTEKKHNPNYQAHLIEVPFRMLVIAASGGGKNIFLTELIHQMSDTFERIDICCRNRDEPLYDLLAKRCKGMIHFHESKVPDIETFRKEKKQQLIVFDDLILSKQLNVTIGEYFLRARKYDISCVYLAQSFFGLPKFIRQQSQYIVLKKIASVKDLKLIIREISIGLDIDELTKIYKDITNENKLNFFMIDLVNPQYRYRFNFTPLDIQE